MTDLKKVFLKNLCIYIVFFLSVIYSCNNDDEIEPPRDFGEQAVLDQQSLEDFLSTHFYNYEDFENNDSNVKIIIDSIYGETLDKIPLINQVKKNIINVRISEGSYVDHPIYTLIAREGNGQSPSVVDSTYVSYKGLLLNKSTFDESFTPIWFDLTSVVRGFREGIPALKSGEFSVDQNNVPSFSNFGQGAIFMPSGLGYFGRATGSIPAYSPIIFMIDLFLVKQTDHDGDGILSSLEYDNDKDGIPDDSDGDGLADYLDSD